jgi:hypothetical protein
MLSDQEINMSEDVRVLMITLNTIDRRLKNSSEYTNILEQIKRCLKMTDNLAATLIAIEKQKDITQKSIDEIRDDFEQWYVKHINEVEPLESFALNKLIRMRSCDGNYAKKYRYTNACWWAWQESAKTNAIFSANKNQPELSA